MSDVPVTKGTSSRARRIIRGILAIFLFCVLAFVGLLVFAVLSATCCKTNDAREARARQDISNIGVALRMHQRDVGVFPSQLNALLADFGGNTNRWKGPYMERLSNDPWQHDYQYRFPGLHETNGFDLSSLGKDGVPSRDDITNWERE